jgi:2-isopropylmalate synthase
VAEVGNAPHNLKLPYVGAEAFAHKAGLHVNAIMKSPETYEHISPDVVGNQRTVLVSDLSGRSNIQHKLAELDIELTPEQTFGLLADIKKREHQGMVYEDAGASFELLAMKAAGLHVPQFQLVSYFVTSGHGKRGEGAEATVKVKVGRERLMAADEGLGPVHALDGALRKALITFFPQLQRVRLVDYKVRVVDNESGTAARVRVWIQASDGRRTWNTVGASPNIVTASAAALIDSLEYSLLTVEEEARQRLTG